MQTLSLTAVITREGDGYVSLCPELGVASQGDSIEDSQAMLQEAVELFLEVADDEEIERRYHPGVYITRLEVAVG